MSRLYRALLLAYPQPFRRRFGQAIVEAFEQELREAHGRGRVRPLPALLWRALRDSLATSLQMRWAAWRGRPGPSLSRRETPSWRWLGHAGGSGSRQPGRGDGRREPEGMLDRAERLAVFDAVWKDFRYAVRALRKSPAFTAVVVVSLALGIGATSTIFSAINPILIRPPAFADPDRLVEIYRYPPVRPGAREPLTASTYHNWRQQGSTVEQIEWSIPDSPLKTYPGNDGAERVRIQAVSWGLFGLLGVEPILGRDFVAEDRLPGDIAWTGRSLSVILSYGLWQRRFGGDPDILGQTWGDQVVVGVMPPRFRLYPWNVTDAWVPLDVDDFERSGLDGSGNVNWYHPFVRLKPGVSLEQARAEAEGIGRGLDQSWLSADSERRARVASLHENSTVGYSRDLYILMGAVFVLLLIACSNVASLLLGRATTRRHEITTRAALGAGRLRLMWEMLTESIVLAFAGGALGVLVAHVGVYLFINLSPGLRLPLEDVHVDGEVLGFTLLLSLLTVFVFGSAPAWRASKPDLAVSLKQGGRGDARRTNTLGRQLLVGSQVALTFVLLAGTALMISSLVRLVAVDRGIDPEHVVTAQIDLAGERYVTRKTEDGRIVNVLSPAVNVFYQEVLERLRARPGVEAAELVNTTVYQRWFSHLPDEYAPGRESPLVVYRSVSPGFPAAMGIPLLKGRFLSERDTASSPMVAVINEALAREFFPGEDPIGRLVQPGQDPPREIVGIVGDTRRDFPEDLRGPLLAGIYVADAQHQTDYVSGGRWTYLNKRLVLKTTLDPASVAADVRRIVADVDPGVPVHDFETMQALMGRTVTTERFWMRALGIFATLALVLAAVGIYGVVAYAVAQRTQEIGVRMALGAQRTDVLKMVIRQGMVMTVGGVIVGVLGAFAATRLLSSWLYGVEATDPATFATVAVVVVGIALLATYVPARGAARVDPVKAMRSE